MDRPILIIAELVNKKIAPITLELIAAAEELRRFTTPECRIKVLIPTLAVTEEITQLTSQLSVDIIALTPGNQIMPDEQVFKSLSPSLFADLNPAFICMAHNTNGLDSAPGIAVMLNAACITGVEKIYQTDDGPCFTRSLFSDRITADIRPHSVTTVLTIQPGCFKSQPTVSKSLGTVSVFSQSGDDSYTLVEFQPNTSDTSGLANSDIIVSAGNGIKEKQHLDLIYELASLFPKSAVAGSRPICDKKWMTYNQQVGITGATVKPKLYIACGISGASQHISGMRDSRFIVSINRDPHAAIFNISDVCIVEDLLTFIPQVIALLEGT